MDSERVFNKKIDAKDLINSALSYKWLYICTIVLFLGCTYFYNYTAKTIFQVKASILIGNNSKSSMLGSSDLSKGFDALQTNKNIENEIEILKSFSLTNYVVSQLGLEVSYFVEKRNWLKTNKDVFLDFPFKIVIDKSHRQPIGAKFYIELVSDTSFRIHSDAESVVFFNYIDNKEVGMTPKFKVDQVYSFRNAIVNDNFKFDIDFVNKDAYKILKKGYRFYFEFYELDQVTLTYQNNLKVEAASTQSSIINLTLKGENPQKISAFLNKFLTLSQDKNLEKKNTIASSTIKFIDSQISDIADTLNSAESNLRAYRTSNQVVDLSFQGKSIYDKMSALESEKANLLIQKKYFDYLIEYFAKNKIGSDLVPPSMMRIVDPLLNQLINELISLNAERSNLPTNNPNSFLIEEIDKKIKQRKETILENVKNNLNTLNFSINELNYRSDRLSTEISRIPKTELQLMNYDRKFKLSNDIYTFLLEKRSESQILKASNTPDSDIIDFSKESLSKVVAPNKPLNLILAFLVAFLLPTGFLIFKDYFNNSIVSISDLQRITNIPIIGVILNNRKKSPVVVAEFPRTSIAETFRTVRTNLQLKEVGNLPQVFLLTSTASNEGKSFLSLNLALSFAALGSKVVLVEFDLRRPTIHERINVNSMVGISSYLLNKAVMEDIQIKTQYENLDFIPAGPILPNPSEVLHSPRLDKLFNELKGQYDYVIVDTAPLGPVADSYWLLRFANESLIVVRQNETSKELLINTLQELKNKKFTNLNLLLNDINLNLNSYNYKNNYKYYGDDGDSETFSPHIKGRKTKKSNS